MLGSTLGQHLLLTGAAVTAIAATVASVDPIFLGREPVMRRLVSASWIVRDSAVAASRGAARSRSPWARAAAEKPALAAALESEQFETDRQAFRDDLVATGRVAPARADSLAHFAVREAYKKRVPPALVFGVLVTENRTFKSRARSSVGAMGLMQVYGKVWVPTLGKLFGRDLADDETNLRYGVHILSEYLYRSAGRVATAERAVSTGLLRYNGCVRGTNTPNCHRYPAQVRRAVERYATAQCADGGYAACVEEPMRVSMAADDAEDGGAR